MVSEYVILAVLERKSRRRLGEYIVLGVVQGFFVAVFTPVVEFALALLLGVLMLGVGVSLAWLREQRRTLINPYQRLAVEASESFLLLALLGASAFIAYSLRMPLVTYQAHLSYALFGYLMGSVVGEVGWRVYIFERLSGEEQYRYVQNLSPSVLLPYSWRHLKWLRTRWRTRR